MEFGARALGNRSILAAPQDPKMRNKLNYVIKEREGFRPFAPSVVLEEANKYFDIVEPVPYMNIVVKSKTKKIPSAVHVDKSSRVQTVTKKQHSTFYNILSELDKSNEIPVILNTSFNIKGRPILTTIEDAIYVLENTELDYLIIENYLFTK